MKDKYLITHYLPLIAILLSSFVGFYIFSYDKMLKISLSIATGLSYLVWGIIHHYIHHDLDLEIIVEYFVICIFGVTAIILLVI